MSETTPIRALLDLEDTNDDVLFERVAGTEAFLWPLARWPLASVLASLSLNVTAHIPTDVPGTKLYFLKRMLREALFNPASSDRLRSSDAEHLFIVSGTTLTSAPRGVGNWLSDAFAESLGDRAVVVQDANFDLLTPRRERPANPRTRTFGPALARVRDAVKASPPPALALQHAERTLSRVFTLIGDVLPARAQTQIMQQVALHLTLLPHVSAEFSALLDRARPRRIYMQSASYGDRSNLIRIAHERGIEVAELQHGWIGSSHAAYNFGSAFVNSELTSSLPDTLLSFGEYWGRSLRFPGRVIPVGKPPLDQAAALALPYSQRHHRVLIVSSDYERERLVESALLLRRLLPSTWDIVLRPHPSEQMDAEMKYADALAGGITLDNHLNVNASIASSRAVVGQVSTVLFEALPLEVHIGVLESGLADFYAETDVFPIRLDGEASFQQFASLISSNSLPDSHATASIWQPDSVARFREFAES